MTKHLEGRRFGRLVVKCVSLERPRGVRAWDCVCDCGNVTVVPTADLLRGHTTSCGCAFTDGRKAYIESIKKDLLGQTFGRLTVVAHAGVYKGRHRWLCKCSCGKQVVVSTMRLRSSKGTRSCGCLRDELTAARRTTHGGTRYGNRERLYNTYNNMLRRCYDKKLPSYKYYGARGISVCEEWVNSYEAFRLWALTHGYANDLTIERIDNNGNYCPDNCTWIPKASQVLNRRPYKSRFFGGKRVRMKDIINAHGISENVFYARIRYGWSVERALNTPVRHINSGKEKEEQND